MCLLRASSWNVCVSGVYASRCHVCVSEGTCVSSTVYASRCHVCVSEGTCVSPRPRALPHVSLHVRYSAVTCLSPRPLACVLSQSRAPHEAVPVNLKAIHHYFLVHT